MGNAQRSHDDLVHVRGWTRQQIDAALDTVRRQSAMYRMTKDDFARYFGGRNREVVSIFHDLDTDYDGVVDVFEVLTVLTVWSGISWEDKQDALFTLFDMMGKGFLKIDELILMGTVLVQALSKFMQIDPELQKRTTLQKLAHSAMPHNETKLTPENFRLWVKNCEPLERLKGLVEDHAPRGQPDTNASRMRMQMSALDRHSAKLCDRIERLQNELPEFADACMEYVSAWGRRKRWDFLMQNMRQLVMRLQHVSDSMHTTLAELEQALGEEELSGGTAALVEPQRRLNQERSLGSLDLMRAESLTDLGEATDLLERLIELTEPADVRATTGFEASGRDALNAIAEDENEGVIDISPPRVAGHRAAMRKVHNDMRADLQEGGCFYRKPMEQAQPAAAGGPAGGGGGGAGQLAKVLQDAVDGRQPTPNTTKAAQGKVSRELPGAVSSTSQPVLVAIADFEPPPSHQTQMLKLLVGDQVTVLGQDGRGWWYGRKQDGKEGWFPPSYVQLEAAHFSSAGQ